MNEEFLKVINKHERINNLYTIGTVHKAQVEDFINEIVSVINNSFDDDVFQEFIIQNKFYEPYEDIREDY